MGSAVLQRRIAQAFFGLSRVLTRRYNPLVLARNLFSLRESWVSGARRASFVLAVCVSARTAITPSTKAGFQPGGTSDGPSRVATVTPLPLVLAVVRPSSL